jgi:chromosome partitioning protein
MNPNATQQFLTDLFQQGAVVVAFVAVAAAIACWAGWWLRGLFLGREIDWLREEVKRLNGKLQERDDRIGALESENRSLDHENVRLKAEDERLRTQNKKLRSRVVQLEDDLAAARKKDKEKEIQVTTAENERDRVKQERDDLKAENDGLRTNLAKATERLTYLEEINAGLGADNLKVKDDYANLLTKANKLFAHLTKMRAQAGRMWEREVGPDATRFAPLHERSCPITAIMNLKGGVGKTTLSYFIARTLAKRGKRVLLVDLDHQRSLSQAFVSQSDTNTLLLQQRTLPQYLLSPTPTPLGFFNCAQKLSAREPLSIVVSAHSSTGEGLAEAENRLEVGWIATPDGPDNRMLLRQALHDPTIQRMYDHIILDCPPRFGIASINGLAASDFLLIPVNLDGTATVAAPHFLRELRRLRASVLPAIQLLGIVANRATIISNKLSISHQDAWDSLAKRCQGEGVWDEEVYFFNTTIRDTSEIAIPVGQLADSLGPRPALPTISQKTATFFDELVTEIEGRREDASRYVPGLPAGAV